ncbi:MAG: LPD38 domain-containing protein [Candidatus Pristimantibacillus sp.]
MASKYDEVRKNRQQRGAEAKQRVLSGVYNQPAQTAAASSKYAGIRNRNPESALTVGTSFTQLPSVPNAFDQLSAAQTTVSPKVTGPIALPTFEQQVGNATRFSAEADAVKARRQEAAKKSPLSKLATITNKVADAIIPDSLVSKMPAPVAGSIVDKARQGTPIIEQIGQGVKATEIPGLTDNNPVTNFIRGAGDTATLGVSSYTDRMMGLPERAEGATQTGAGKVGQFAGGVFLPAGKLKAGTTLLRNMGRGAAAGAVLGVGIEGGEVATGRNDQSLADRALDVGISSSLGGVGVAGVLGIGKVAQKIMSKYRPAPVAATDTLALPAPRQRGNVNTAQTADVISPEYTFELPEPSSHSVTRNNNVAQTRGDLKVIDDEIRQIQSGYDRAIVEEYQYLKSSMGQGKAPGGIIRNVDGEVTGRYGWQSNNPVWYQEFGKVNGRKPTNKDLYELAKSRVDNGFNDEQGVVPSWKTQNGFDESMEVLKGVRDQITRSLREMDPAINITETPLSVSENSFTREISGPIRKADPAIVSDALPTAPEITPMQLPTEPSSSILGVSAFGGKAKAYDNVSTDTKSQLVTRANKERLPLNVLSDQAYTKMVDDLHPINQFDKAVERAIDGPLETADRAHTQALNTRGADVIARQILTAGQVDSTGNIIPGSKSLKEILSRLPNKKNSYVDFEDYLLNKHAITRAGRNEKVFRDELNWTPESGASKVAAYEQRYPQFKEMADEVYQFQRNMVEKWLVETGMLTDVRAQAFMDENPTYVPNKRFFSEMEKGNGGKGKASKGFGGQNAQVKKYQKGGSQRKIISPIESMIENVDAFVKAAKRNEVMQTVVKNLQRDPDALADFMELVPENQAMSAQSLKEINATLGEDGIDGLIANLTNDFDASYRKATQTGLDKDNVVRVMVDGEPVYVQVNDKALLNAIMAMGPDSSNIVMQIAGKITQTFKTLTTGANPVFSLARNLWRDIPSAYNASKTTNNPLVFMADLVQSAYEIATNGKLFQDFLNVGGGHSSSVAADRNLLSQSKRQILPQRNKLSGAVPRAYDALQNAMNAVESAPRLAEFKRLGDDKVSGLFQAQDVTVNFKRRGSVAKELDKIFPYFNAAVQGLDKFARMYKDNPTQALVKSAMAVSIPAMVAYAINYDNPDYEKVSRRTKDNFYLFPNPAKEGTFIKIAKPKEIGTVFADIPERLMDLFAKQDPKAFADFADQIRSTFLVPGIQGAAKSGGITDRLAGATGDTIFGPIADIQANQNFAGSPIVPAYLERLSPELQSDARTSSLSKWIGENTGTSPKKLDYLIKQYSGVLGQVGLPMLTPGAGDNPLQALGSSLAQQMTVDPVYSNDIMNRFYDKKSELDQAKTDFSVTGELPDDYNDGLRKYLSKVQDAISDIRKQMRVIEADRTIPAAEKRETLRQMQERMNRFAAQANTQSK